MGERPSTTPLLAILSYHKIGPPPLGVWEPWFYVPETLLVEHLQLLSETGWSIVDLPTALRGLSKPDSLPERSVLLTFDDGYRSVFERALPVLAARGYPGVMFVPIETVGRTESLSDSGEPLDPICGWDELREADAAGISVQSHGLRHVAFSELEPHQIVNELIESKRRLDDRLEKNVEVFAFPYGDGGRSPARVTQALRSSGYTAAFLYGGGPVTPGVDNRYRLSRLAIGPDTDLVAALGPDACL